MRNKKNHLSAMVVLNTIVSIMGSTILGALSSAYFGSILVAFYSFFLTYFILTISKILPKLLAINHSSKVFEFSVYTIRILYFFTVPMLWTTQIVTFWLAKDIAKDSKKDEEEFHAIIDYYTDKGVIHDTEKSVFERVMKMKSKKANELFSKSTEVFEITSFQINSNDINKHYEENPPRKIFVIHKNNVIGVLYKKDISRSIAYDNGKTKVVDLMREPILISQNDNLFEVVHRLNIEDKSVAVVLNEDNKPVGVLTPKVIYRYLLKNVNLLSTIDLDTGVLSRKNFIQRIEEFFNKHKEEHTENKKFSILFLNIKEFSDYNDKYGYHQGDKILKEISKHIQNHIPNNAILGRLGEGFGIILDGVDENETMKIFRMIEKDLKLKNISLYGAATEYSKNFEHYLEMIRVNNGKIKTDRIFNYYYQNIQESKTP